MAYRSGISRERSRKRRQLLWRATIWLAVAGVLGALGWSAYQTGSLLAESRVMELDRRVRDLSAQLDGTRSDNLRLQSALAEARQSNVALQSRYDSDVPKGEPAELFGITRDRLAQGVTAARLAQVLREAGPARPCETRVTRKRFGITVGRAAEDAASLLDGLVQVSVSIPAAGGDAARTAAVTVARAWAAEPLKLTGLPAKQDIAINNAVLHLTVEASDLAGYATASLSVCGKG